MPETSVEKYHGFVLLFCAKVDGAGGGSMPDHSSCDSARFGGVSGSGDDGGGGRANRYPGERAGV